MLLPDTFSPLWVSLQTASVATALAAVAGTLAARWMLSHRGRSRGLLDGILTLPLVLPPTVVGFLLLLLLGKNGPVGQLLERFGIALIFTWTAAVLAATVVAFPLMYKTVLSAFEQVDATLIDSARTLGASEERIFWQILLPLAWPGVIAGTILAFARSLGEFGATLMVAGSIPGVTQTMPIAIFFAAEAGKMGVALVWVLLMVAISLGAIAGLNYANRRRAARTTPIQQAVQRGFNWLYFRTPASSYRGGRSRRFPEGGSPGDREFPTAWPSAPRPDPAPTAPIASLSPHLTEALRQAAEQATEPVATGAIATRLRPAPRAAAGAAAAHLLVEIEKRVPGFELQVSFQSDREPLGLLGASGSGKSMTLRCIAGLETPTQGRIVLNGRVLFDAERRINLPSRQRHVGLVFQHYALFPHLTVAQNIAFGMQAMPRRQRAAEVASYLERLDLTGLGDRYPRQLSGGQQQRVALARALAIHPDILLLDEPLSALDTHLRSQIEKLLVEVLAEYSGITLFITHKLEEAYRLCPKLLVLGNGRVLAAGAKEAIFQAPPTFAVARVTECKNFSRARRLGEHSLEALDWGCSLELARPIPADLHYVGLRAHHLQFPLTAESCNTFPVWLAAIAETQHSVTLYLKLHERPSSTQDYHLQAEIYRDKWESLRDRPLPWLVRLEPGRLIALSQ